MIVRQESLNVRRQLPLARLPISSEVLTRLLEIGFEDENGIREFTSLIGQDPGMAGRILSVAAASVPAEQNIAPNLKQCIMLVGLVAIKTIVVNESTAQVFDRSGRSQQPAFSRIWAHSLKSALLARLLAREMSYGDPEEAYLAGLMHDVGSLALGALDPEHYWPCVTSSHDDTDLCRTELAQYQATHASVGGWLAESWRLDSFLSDSIHHHHEPAERVATAHPLIRIVLLADRLANLDGTGDWQAADQLARLCGAQTAGLALMVRQANEELGQIASKLGIDLERSSPSTGIIAAASSPAHDPISRLKNRFEERLLVDMTVSLAENATDIPSALRGLAQAVLVLFRLNPSVFFLREGQSDEFVGRHIDSKYAKVSQLKFFASQSDSILSRALGGTASIWFSADERGTPLDEQLSRLLDAEGLVGIPMGTGSQCKGIIVSAIDSDYQARTLKDSAEMLRAFGMRALPILARIAAPSRPAQTDVTPSVGLIQERVNHLLHEVSNPLSIVGNYIFGIQSKLGPEAEVHKDLRIVAEELERIKQILENFRFGTQNQSTAATPMALQDLIPSLLELCKGSSLVPPGVKIETHVPAMPAAYIADPDRLKQVLLNLLKNAFEAMPEGGKLCVTTAPWGDGHLADHVEIVVEDSGPGLPESVYQNLYQPRTSTKGGTHFGIGLSIVGRLVGEMDGIINCRSDKNGTCFRIILPVTKP